MTRAGSPFFARLPLVAVYALSPLAVLAARLFGRLELAPRLGPQGLGLWVALAGAALLFCLGRDSRELPGRTRPAWTGLALAALMAACVFVLLRLFGPGLSQAQDWAALLDELRLPALALFAAAWIWSFGAPRRADLALLGGVLGGILLLDFLFTAIMARQVVLGGGLLLGGGQADTDSMALLLCIALSATLDPPDQAPAQSPEAAPGPGPAARPPHAPVLARWLILAGLFATFSRSGLLAAGLIVLFFERGPLQERLALFCACVLGIWMSLALPLARTAGGGDELGLGWHLAALGEALRQDPRAWLTGLPLNDPVALAMPDPSGMEWLPESAGLAVGVFDIPSSWLRLLAGWGLGAPLLVLGALLACALRGRRRFGLGLLAATLVTAALTPALHTPATAGVLALGCGMAWQARPKDAPDAH